MIHYVFAQEVCHSYNGNGTATNAVNFGYKPKMVIIKRATAGTTGNYNIYDNVRSAGDFDTAIYLSSSGAEFATSPIIELTDTGIIIKSNNSEINAAGSSYILIAIPEL